jgi:hypothetical protein
VKQDRGGVKLIATGRREQNRAAIDPWTAVHLSAGLAAGLVKVPRTWALAAAFAYELTEQYLERTRFGQDLFETRGPESVPNAVIDTGAFMAGHWLGSLWLRTR